MESKGIKRKVVALLALVIDVLAQIPGLGEVIIALETATGMLGGTAVIHAGANGTLNKEKLAGAVSALYFVIFLANFTPLLVPLLPTLYKTAGVLAAVRLGTAVSEGE